jgi:hypothetical protein
MSHAPSKTTSPVSPTVTDPLNEAPPPPPKTGLLTCLRHCVSHPKVRIDGIVAWSAVLAAYIASKYTQAPCDYK